MCDFFSGIVIDKGRKLLWDADIDSHEELIKKFGLGDSTIHPNFVRVEFTPPNGDALNHDFSLWTFKTDQDFKPEWYDEIGARKLALAGVSELITDRFVINRTLKEIKEGRYWIGKDGTIEVVSGNGQVKSVYGNGKVNSVYENGQVKSVYGNGQVKSVYENGQVNSVYGNGQVNSVSGNGQVNYVYENGQVNSVYGNGQVNYVYENGQVNSVYGNGQVNSVYENGQVESVYGNGKVNYVYGNGQVKSVYENGKVNYVYGNGKVLDIKDTGIVFYAEKKILMVADPKIRLKRFKTKSSKAKKGE